MKTPIKCILTKPIFLNGIIQEDEMGVIKTEQVAGYVTDKKVYTHEGNLVANYEIMETTGDIGWYGVEDFVYVASDIDERFKKLKQ